MYDLYGEVDKIIKSKTLKRCHSNLIGQLIVHFNF